MDHVFREKLHDYSTEPPMHLFAGIEQGRAQRKAAGDFRLTGLWLLLGFSLLIGGGIWLLQGKNADAFLTGVRSPALEAGGGPALTPACADSEEASAEADLLSVASPGARPVHDLSLSTAVPAPGRQSVSLNGEARAAQSASPPPVPPATGHERASATTPPSASQPPALMAGAGGASQAIADMEVEFLTEDLDPAGQSATANADIQRLEPFGPLSQQWNLFYKRPQLFAEKTCEDFKGQPLSWYLGLVLSPDIAIRSLNSKSPEYADYAKNRNQTESFNFAFSTGLRLTAKSGMGLGLRSGFNYSEIMEDFEYQNENEVRIIIQEIYDQNGNILGTDTTYEYGTRVKRTFNRYRTIDVPVMIGYEVEFPKLTLAVYGGAYFNLAFATRGDFLSPELEPVTFTTGADDAYPAFRDHLGLSLGGSMGIYYQLSDRLQLVLEPQFRYFLQPVTREEYLLNQKYFTTGITTGLRLKL